MTKAETREAIAKALENFDGEVEQLPDGVERYHRADSRYHFITEPSPLQSRMAMVRHNHRHGAFRMKREPKLQIWVEKKQNQRGEKLAKMRAAERLERLTTL